MNRSADWLHQTQADLDLAVVSAAAGHHEWASRPGALDSAAAGEIFPQRSVLRWRRR